MAGTAFEAITTRQAWYASAAISKYDAVEFGSDGKYQKADGTGIFAGICEYGAAAVAVGAKLTVDSAHAGQMKTATAADAVYGVALNAAAAGELVSIAMVEAPIPGKAG